MHPVFAAGIENVTSNHIATLEGLEGAFENIVGALLAIAGIILFFMLISGGVAFITSGGDPKGLESAKKTLTFAIAGMILVALAFLILRFVSVFTGNSNFLNFDVRI